MQWGQKLQTIIPIHDQPGHQYKLTFRSGREEIADLVVGADGAWSAVRPLLSPAKPVYSGITFIDLTISDVDNRLPAIASLVGHGMTSVLSDSKGFMAQRNSGGKERVYVALTVPENWLSEFEGGILSVGDIGGANAERTKEAILKLFPGWSSECLDIIRFCDSDPIVARKIYGLPFPHTWETRRGLTLLGDAAHLMPPSGEGVNLAMADGLELAAALADACRDGGVAGEGGVKADFGDRLEEAIRSYEKKICERGAQEAVQAEKMQKILYGKDTPQSFVNWMAEMMAAAGLGGPQ